MPAEVQVGRSDGWLPNDRIRLIDLLRRSPTLVGLLYFETIEGEQRAPQIYLLIEWPSKHAAEAFYESAEYRPHRESRQQGSRGQFVLVAGEDASGVALI